jgi:hypothetical protein
MRFGLVVLQLCGLAASAATSSSPVSLASYDSETAAMLDLQRRGITSSDTACGNQVTPMLASDALKRGWFLLAESMAVACAAKENDKLIGVISETVGSIRASLQRISQMAQLAKAKAPLEPAFQWAQSANAVFINVKFAHKLDAPACIDLVEPEHEIEPTKIRVRAGCKDSDKKFLLDLDLYAAVNTTASSFALTSVGRGSFTLVKAIENKKWKRLLVTQLRPKNMHAWFDLQEQYESELENLPDVKEEEEKEVVQPSSTTTTTTAQIPTIEDKLEADKTRIRALAQTKRSAVEQAVQKKKTELQKQNEAKMSELDAKAGMAVTRINQAMYADLDAVEKMRAIFVGKPAESYSPVEPVALQAVDHERDEL